MCARVVELSACAHYQITGIYIIYAFGDMRTFYYSYCESITCVLHVFSSPRRESSLKMILSALRMMLLDSCDNKKMEDLC